MVPQDMGAVIDHALSRLAAAIPPDDDGYLPFDTRVADTLYELCSSETADDRDADRATVVVHVDAPALSGGEGSAELADMTPLPQPILDRITCDCRLQVALHDPDGTVAGIGRTSRNVPPWLKRQLLRRDRGCRFPGCPGGGSSTPTTSCTGPTGGPTEPDNLICFCRFHHTLVHEKGWEIRGSPEGVATLVTPDGRELSNGPPGLDPTIKQRLFGPDELSA